MLRNLSLSINADKNKLPVKIAIEGIDGSGKTTQVTDTCQYLMKEGYEVKVFRYTASRCDLPGKLILKMYKTKHNKPIILESLLNIRILQESLFAWQASLNLRDLDKKDHCDIMLCDRCAITSYAAHVKNPAKPGYWETLLLLIESRFVPDYVIYLNVPVEIALSRLSSRGGFSNDENYFKLQQIKSNYEALVSGEWVPRGLRMVKKWLIVDGHQTQEVVHSIIRGIIKTILEEECGR